MKNKDKIKNLVEDLGPIEGRFQLVKEDIRKIQDRVSAIESSPREVAQPADTSGLQSLVSSLDEKGKRNMSALYDRIDEVSLDVSRLERSSSRSLLESKDEISSIVKDIISDIKRTRRDIEQLVSDVSRSSIEGKEELTESLKVLEKEMKKEIALLKSRPLGGGGLSRQIFIGGADPLTRYTDMNIKAGSNVTITYQNNDVTKKVDVTIIAAGGGSGSGIVRSINSISTPTSAGNSSTTDYVYLVSGTTTLTLPDATSGNTNLYTVKNVGNGTVTVATVSAQTIDGSASITLPVKYTSVDIESDGSNWNVT